MSISNIFNDFTRAVRQVSDVRFIKLVATGLGLTLALLIGATMGVQSLLPDSISIWWFGEIKWLTKLLSGFALIAMIGLSVFLMVPVACLFIGLFLDRIVDAVEARHYPNLPPANHLSMTETVIDSLKFLCLLITVNLFALILYLIFTPFAPILFWMINGFLLGREYFQLVAMRRLGRKGARDLRVKHRPQIFVAGTLMAVPLTIPFINLIIPLIGVATFTHLYHRLVKPDG